ncbi:Uncharacterised protein [Klebsiella variicola]|nr:Uncharacterised protein [Klebsiella variicola]
MFADPEIRLWRERQETFGGQVNITKLQNAVVIFATKPGVVILLADVTVVSHNGIRRFAILVIDPLIQC